jgi:hypothetical protein
VACSHGWWPADVFYPLGYRTLYAYTKKALNGSTVAAGFFQVAVHMFWLPVACKIFFTLFVKYWGWRQIRFFTLLRDKSKGGNLPRRADDDQATVVSKESSLRKIEKMK